MSNTLEFPNWFVGQKYNFENNLSEFKGLPNLKFLQIGAYTGDASVWLLDNILTDPTSTLTDVDTWEGSNEIEHQSISFTKVHNYYLERTKKYNNLLSIQSKSEYVLSNLNQMYDFIYIDGDHTSKVVAADAEDSWKILKSSGILAFDDYLWGEGLPEHLTPRPAINNFLNKYAGAYDILSEGYQIWIMKK